MLTVLGMQWDWEAIFLGSPERFAKVVKAWILPNLKVSRQTSRSNLTLRVFLRFILRFLRQCWVYGDFTGRGVTKEEGDFVS